MLLIICEFHDNRRSDGRTSVMGVNEITVELGYNAMKGTENFVSL
jgi:hypothetical protein